MRPIRLMICLWAVVLALNSFAPAARAQCAGGRCFAPSAGLPAPTCSGPSCGQTYTYAAPQQCQCGPSCPCTPARSCGCFGVPQPACHAQPVTCYYYASQTYHYQPVTTCRVVYYQPAPAYVYAAPQACHGGSCASGQCSGGQCSAPQARGFFRRR